MHFNLSIIIATWNRRESVVRLVNELGQCDQMGIHVEVIVVDNGSTDDTYATLAAMAARDSHLKVLSEPIRGKNKALNRALHCAKGDIFLFTDDDIIPSHDWMRKIYDASKRWPSDAVFGGRIVPSFPPAAPDWLKSEQFKFSTSAFCAYSPSEREEPVSIPPFGANFAVRRGIFDSFRYCESIGPAGKAYAMGSETELLERLQAAGHRFIYVPSASVEHIITDEQITDKWLYGRAFRSGRGVMRLRSTDCKMLFGVPRYCYREFLVRTLRYFSSRFHSRSSRVVHGMEWWRAFGEVYESRTISAGLKTNPQLWKSLPQMSVSGRS